MNYADIFTAGSFVWPLTVIFMFLVLVRKAGDEMRPIVVNVINGLARNAQSNAVVISIAFGYAISSSLSAFVEVFRTMDADAFHSIGLHQYLVNWAKILNPFIVTFLARVTLTDFTLKPPGSTTPPFTVASSTTPPQAPAP